MPKTKRASKPAKKTPAELPHWVNNTPEMSYTMEAFSGETHEQINVSVEEYKALKATLAKFRGIAIPEVAHA